ncbi:MAG: trypsin-like peptidase domain-containing protein [Actinomycetota bacterium]
MSPPTNPPANEAVRRPRSRVAVASLAFLLGGAVGAGGFALGAQSTETTETVPATTSTVTANQAAAVDTTATTGQTTAPLDLNVTEPAAAVAASLGPAVVQVETNFGQGSGVVYEEGLILTNHHVIEGAETVRVRTSDGRVFDTEVLGSDPRNDIAVLAAPGADIPVAAIGSADVLQPGQITVAIGSPFRLQQTVTAGIVSSVNRPVPNQDGTVTAMIQTDAPINPGNSGGALANVDGEVVGINTSIRTDGTTNANIGIGFAVPIETAIEVAERIQSGESLEPGVLGVSGALNDDDLGVPLDEIVPDSAADSAGLEVGDRVLSIDGVPVTSIEELAGLIQTHFTGEVIELEVLRGTDRLTVQATLS